MINIAELLKNASKGMTLYSILHGKVEFAEVMDTDYMPIRVMKHGYGLRFDEYGRYMGNEYPDSECLLFPSKDCRTWEGWKPPVQPRFKVGDWVVSTREPSLTYRILESNVINEQGELDYKVEIYSNGVYRATRFITSNKMDEWGRLWAIADAKDGDVLATATKGCTFIYRKTTYNYDLAYYYAGVDGDRGFIHGNDIAFAIVSNVVPATKEQRGLLFQKMEEAGYEWDSETKELRKAIEPTFKVGDEIYRPERNEYFKIKGIEKDNDTVWYVATRTRIADNDKRIGEIVRINAFYQNCYSIAPKPHYDIANFYAGMPVLVRDANDKEWRYVLYSHNTERYGLMRFNAGATIWNQCIPFNDDTKHLLGTTDMPDECYINW